MKKKNHSNEKLEAITFKTLIVGVDIAKHNQWARFVDCRGIEYNKALKFENNRNGFNAILTRIYEICKSEDFTKVIVGMEPTGHYWKAFANFLLKQAKITVVLVNPYHTKKAKEGVYMKRSLVLFLAMVILFCGCRNNQKEVFNSEIYYESDFVSVKIVEKLEEPEECEIQWGPITYYDALIENDVIFQGVVEKATEVLIGSNKMGTHTSVYKTILEVRVSEVIKDSNNIIGDKEVIKVITGTSSRRYETAVASITEGQEYILFTKSSKSVEKDYLGEAEFTDVFISSPIQYIVPVIDGNFCEVRSFYKDLCGNECKMTNMLSVFDDSELCYKIENMLVEKKDISKITAKFKVNDVEVGAKEILADVSNKFYSDVSEVSSDLGSLYLVSKNDFINCIESYIKENEVK